MNKAVFIFIFITTIIVEVFFALIWNVLLRHGSHDDAIVMFCVLKIIFSDDTIAGRLRVTSQCRIFFCNMLSIAADFYVRTIAFIITRQRIGALAVIVVIIIVIPPSAHAPVLLCWPHSHLFSD
ncbi:hypothetical protein FQZ97_962090 [compost metagenome]